MNTTISPITPNRVVNLKTVLLPLFSPRDVSLIPLRRKSSDVRLARRDRLAPGRGAALVRSLPIRPGKLRKMESVSLTVPRVTGSLSPAAATSDLTTISEADLALPMGISRFINVATFKRMLKADRSDVLLRKAGDTWGICPDSMKVDLEDDSVEFRLGPVQIYS